MADPLVSPKVCPLGLRGLLVMHLAMELFRELPELLGGLPDDRQAFPEEVGESRQGLQGLPERLGGVPELFRDVPEELRENSAKP